MSENIDLQKKEYIDNAIKTLNKGGIPSLTGIHFNKVEISYFNEMIEQLKKEKTKNIDIFIKDVLPTRCY